MWMRLTDRFGDQGLIGVAIAVPIDIARWKVDTFLLSCRVIGRQAEITLLEALVRDVAAKGAKEMVGEYLPTPKNSQVADFYSKSGFEPIEGDRLWLLDLTKAQIKPPPFIQVRLSGADTT